MSYYNTQWVAVISSVAAGVTSWVAFSELDNRLLLYSTTVRELSKLPSGWYSLKDSERNLPAKISMLVMSCEGIITKDALSIASQMADTSREAKEQTKKGQEAATPGA